ncbi:MAG: hypothetical protein FWC77_01440 [Defluviitaleaceae bacterium]|nr:hypothetical protein [Defluviitaleaceae bacterium]
MPNCYINLQKMIPLSKATARKLQNLVIVVLIISLLTPTLAYASVSHMPIQYGFPTWDAYNSHAPYIPHPNLLVIEPFYIGGPDVRTPDTHLPGIWDPTGYIPYFRTLL